LPSRAIESGPAGLDDPAYFTFLAALRNAGTAGLPLAAIDPPIVLEISQLPIGLDVIT